jgi:hypothetical protein
MAVVPYAIGAASSPLLWLDASATATVEVASGHVTRWHDNGGNGYAIGTQLLGNSGPTLGDSGGHPALLFNGVDQFLVNAAPIAHAARGLAIVYSYFSVPSNQAFRLFGDNSSFLQQPVYELGVMAAGGGGATSNGQNRIFLRNTTEGAGSLFTPAVPLSTRVMVSAIDDGTAIQYRVNGKTVAFGAISANRPETDLLNRFSIGAYVRDETPLNELPPNTQPVDYLLHGAVHGLLLLSNTTELQAAEWALANQWGLMGALDAEHPFKTAAPYLLTGRAITTQGVRADEVVFRRWDDRRLAGVFTPKADGSWAAYVPADTYDITYFASGCKPRCDGPYTTTTQGT